MSGETKLNIPHPWQQLADDVFLATSLFNREQCDSLLFAINHPVDGESQQQSLNENNKGQPNSMQDYGLVVNDPMLQYWIDDLMNKRLRPIVEKLFPYLPHYDFSSHYAFMTSYSETENHDLGLHVDASHITLNLCLESSARGADLVFTGARCQQHVDVGEDPGKPIRFRQGDAVLHAGNQRHYVTALAGGSRKNLVVWYRLEDEPFDHTADWVKARCSSCQQ